MLNRPWMLDELNLWLNKQSEMAEGVKNINVASKDLKAEQNLADLDLDDKGQQRCSASFLDCLHQFADVLPSRHFVELNQWSIFRVLEPSMLAKIKRLCVFGSEAKEAIFLASDGDVYGLGTNSNSCLGLGDDVHSTFEPRKIEALCQKNVIDISFGYGSGPHVLAVTEDGEVFSWGDNNCHELGNGGNSRGFSPVIVATNLMNRKVVKVACGGHHSMALTSEGEVFAWGQDNFGQVGAGSGDCQSSPYRVTDFKGAALAISIACGDSFSMALMSCGELHGWGCNKDGQLGTGDNSNQTKPCIVKALIGNTISQVICGHSHTLALTDKGEVFSWGANTYGQLGTGNKSNMKDPTKISSKERFVELAASHYSHISAAQNETGKVFIWGQCRGQSVTQPMMTQFSSTDDVFAIFSEPPVSWRMFCVDRVKENRIAETMEDAFDDPKNSDFKFIIEGKTVHVHKAILQLRCEHFQSMFQSCWDEGNKDSIEITQYSYNVYRAFLKFLYTDKVDLQPEEAIGLLDLSNAYCEEVLKMKCEAIIWQGISLENAAMLYAAAIKLGAKYLEDCSFHYIVDHMTAVIQTEAFAKLDELVVKDFIYKASFAKAFKH